MTVGATWLSWKTTICPTWRTIDEYRCCCSPQSFLQAPDAGDFEAFFETFAQKRAEIRVLEADIQEETIQFGDRSLRHGKLTFGKPRRILFRYGIDEPSIMIDGRRVYEFDPLEEQVQLYDIDESPESSIFFLGFDTDPAALREAYDVRVFSMQSAETASKSA